MFWHQKNTSVTRNCHIVKESLWKKEMLIFLSLFFFLQGIAFKQQSFTSSALWTWEAFPVTNPGAKRWVISFYSTIIWGQELSNIFLIYSYSHILIILNNSILTVLNYHYPPSASEFCLQPVIICGYFPKNWWWKWLINQDTSLSSLLCVFIYSLYLLYGCFAGNPLSQDILNLYQEPDGTRKLLNYMLDNLAGKWLGRFTLPHDRSSEPMHI